MNDGKLTQEEINALLEETDLLGTDEEETTDETDNQPNEEMLSSIEIDTLGEIGNISFGSSATTLSTLLGHKVDITTPVVSLVKKTGIKEEFPYEHVSLQVNYVDGFSGENVFLMKTKDAAVISDIMLGGEGLEPKEELTELELSAVQEAMNQMMGASATSMSTIFQKKVDISPPTVAYTDVDKLEDVGHDLEGDIFVKVSFHIHVGELIDSSIMQIMPIDFAKTLVHQLLEPNEDTSTNDPIEPETGDTNQVETQIDSSQSSTISQEPNDVATNIAEQPQYIGSQVSNQSSVQPASFSDFDQGNLPEKKQRNLDLLLDIPLQVTVELGRTKQKVEEILDLSPGSILELDKLAGEPVDVLVNQKLIAKGEVVVIDENFGIRVSDIVSQKDRLMKLN